MLVTFVRRLAVYEEQSIPTFLPLVELWRARVIDTGLLGVCEDLSTTFVNTLLRHVKRSCSK